MQGVALMFKGSHLCCWHCFSLALLTQRIHDNWPSRWDCSYNAGKRRLFTGFRLDSDYFASWSGHSASCARAYSADSAETRRGSVCMCNCETTCRRFTNFEIGPEYDLQGNEAICKMRELD